MRWQIFWLNLNNTCLHLAEFMSFLSNFTYSKLMQTETMMNEFTIKVSTFKELSEEQIEQLIDKIFDNDPNIFYAERSDKM